MTVRRSWIGRLWRGWIALLVRCYPRRFRDTLGADLAAQYLDRTPAGPADFIRRVAAAARDLGSAGVGARLDDLRAAGSPTFRSTRLLGGLLMDLRLGARALRRQPLYSITIVLTLALASGLTTAVFAIYDVTLVRPLPIPDDRRVASIGSRWTGFDHSAVSIPEYLDYRSRADAFAAIAAIRTVSVNLTSPGVEPERLQGARVTASYFDVMQVAPALGRAFSPEEDRPGGPDVALISHELWRTRLGTDPAVVGRVIALDDRPVTVLGVMPPGFGFPTRDTQVWMPLAVNLADPGGRGAHNRQVVARLAAGRTLADARVQMDRIALQLQQENLSAYPHGSGWGLSVQALRDRLVGDLRAPLRLLLAAVVFLLLIAAANVSGLMLARAADRHLEFAARTALGAPRLRLLRLVVVEGLIAGLAGAAIGLGVADLLLRVLESDLPAAASRPDVVFLDPRVLAFTFGTTALATAVAASYSAVSASRQTTAEALRSATTRASANLTMRRLRAALVTGEVAAAFMLLLGAGLALSSFARLTKVDPGLSVENVFTARLTMPAARYPAGSDAVAFFTRLLEEVGNTAGVRHAGAVSILPLSGSDTDFNFGVEGYVPPPGQGPNAQARLIGGHYFEALGIPLDRGRLIDARDTDRSPAAVVVSELLARKYWGEADPVGRRLKLWSLDDPGPWRTVVGVVGDVRHFGPAEPAPPTLYVPVTQFAQRTMTVVVRTAPGVAGDRVIADQVRRLDPGQPLFAQRTMREWLSLSVARPRFNLTLLSVFAMAALLLAVFGIHGLMAFVVASQRQELGIRVALGASQRGLLGSLIGRAVRMTLLGLGVGTVGALALGRWIAALFYGVEAIEPLIFVVAAGSLAAAAVLASVLAARRVLRLDVTAALRG